MSPPLSFRLLSGATAEAGLAALPLTGLAILYKHSSRCGISLTAREEVEQFAAARPDVPIFQLDVGTQRPLSQALAALLNIPHASPQVVLLRDQRPIWTASHFRITAAALAAAVSGDPGESTGRRAS